MYVVSVENGLDVVSIWLERVEGETGNTVGKIYFCKGDRDFETAST
jgi:hypothetical protein